jgi:putative peptidoglycan lipid II flippase
VVLLVAMGGTTQGGFALSNPVNAGVSMVVIAAVMTLVYVGVLVALRNPELGAILRPVFHRLRRRG